MARDQHVRRTTRGWRWVTQTPRLGERPQGDHRQARVERSDDTPSDRKFLLPEGPSVPGSVPGRNWLGLSGKAVMIESIVVSGSRLLAGVMRRGGRSGRVRRRRPGRRGRRRVAGMGRAGGGGAGGSASPVGSRWSGGWGDSSAWVGPGSGIWVRRGGGGWGGSVVSASPVRSRWSWAWVNSSAWVSPVSVIW